jgi:hypothetical protein
MKKLVQAIRGNKDCRLKDLEMMTEFQHTGTNEQINNLHNCYLPKSCSFGHKQAIVRAALTAIDHNSNVNRKPALDHDGEERYDVVNTRDGQVWTAKVVKEPKNTTWRNEIVGEVLQVNRIQVINLLEKFAGYWHRYLPGTYQIPKDLKILKFSSIKIYNSKQ